MRFSLACLSITLLSLTIANASAKEPPTTDEIERSVQREIADRERRRAEIADLIRQATTAPTPAERGSAALAAATAATDGAAKTIHAIDAALGVVEFNVRHADTTGFKRMKTVVPGDAAEPISSLDLDQGRLENTGRDLDLGISGNGWIRVRMSRMPKRLAYTRCGNLFVSSDGELLVGLDDGYPLDPPIVLPPGATVISISEDGLIQYFMRDDKNKVVAGQIQLTTFVAADRLAFQEPGLYLETKASGPPIDGHGRENNAGIIISGFLEASNTDLDHERLRLRFLLNWREAVTEMMHITAQPPTTEPVQ